MPVFDRLTERTINSASLIPGSAKIIVVEGNYLLLNEPGWEALQSLWDFTIFLETDLATIE